MEAIGNVVTYLGSFVLVLSLVVFVHEYGHFQAARWGGVAVDTFSIGFGRALAQWRDKHGVVWKIGSLPLGGYVKFTGDANAASAGSAEGFETPEAMAEARKRGLFQAMPVSIRAFVVAAGPLTNFVFSILAFGLLALIVGKDVTDSRALAPQVGAIQANSAAAAAGLQVGDRIRSVDGRAIASFGDLVDAVEPSAGRPLRLEVERSGAIVTLVATPATAERLTETGAEERVGRLGVSPIVREEDRVIERFGVPGAILEGARQTWAIIANTVGYIANIFSGRASAEHFAGPAGILDMSGQVAKAAIGPEDKAFGDRLRDLALSMLALAATLSVAVGFVNLLPIPLLDGGHLAMYGVEAARGRPLSAQAQEWSFRAGFALILSLFLFASWNDLQRFLERAAG